MEDKNITKEILYDNYIVQQKSMNKIAKENNVDRSVIKRWLIESKIELIKNRDNSLYSFNKNYFDNIDSSDKAYWLGFIWGDGYVAKRKRGKSLSYEFKLSLSEKDECHIELFKKYLESNHKINYYEITGFQTDNRECRLFISNNYFGNILYNKYGIIPRRDDFSKIIENVPEEFYADLIRGLIDSDGTITIKDVQYKKKNRKEFSVGLISNISVLNFVNDQFIKNLFTITKYKQVKRHENRDGLVKNIRITGNNIVFKLTNYLYKNKEQISLERKYKKFIFIQEYMDCYIKEFDGFHNDKGYKLKNRREICKV